MVVNMKTYSCPEYQCDFESDDYMEVWNHMDKEHKKDNMESAWRFLKEHSIMNHKTHTRGIKDI